MSDTVKVFVSYSHQDASYLEKDSLLGFLKGLEKEGVEFWTDRNIRPGELWDEVIKTNIQNADIALVLVSQGFLYSEYCQDVEIRNFLAHKTHVFPIILSPCDWRRHEWLKSRQFLPGGDRTIEEHFQDNGSRKRLFLEILQRLRERGELIRQSRSRPVRPTPTILSQSQTPAPYPGITNTTFPKPYWPIVLAASVVVLVVALTLTISLSNGTPGPDSKNMDTFKNVKQTPDSSLWPVHIDVIGESACLYLYRNGRFTGLHKTPYKFVAPLNERIEYTLKRAGYQDKEGAFNVKVTNEYSTIQMCKTGKECLN